MNRRAMITDTSVRFATSLDAAEIAALSCDQIERGLGWNWTAARVARSIRDPDTNVVVVRDVRQLLAFGIMRYGDEAAHLLLFAVRPSHRRKGVGSVILRWLEAVALEGGARRILVECRRSNAEARNFYGEHGFHELSICPGYYSGVEDAVRLEKHLVAGHRQAGDGL